MSLGAPETEFAADGLAGGRSIPALSGSLPPECRKDADTLRRFIRECMERGPPAGPVSPGACREVLLTGATGFIGRYFLRELLRQNSGLMAHCIVRADDASRGFERIRAAMRQAEIWEESFEARIIVVVGDVAGARFGLSAGQFGELCRRIDAVYHLAADISVQASYQDIRRVNTFSIRNVLELCLSHRFKHLFFASTMGVFPQYFYGFANEFRGARILDGMQPDLAKMKEMFPTGMLGYPWSKLTCEQALGFARQLGMPLVIFRLPQTNQSSSGFSPPGDLAVRLFAAIAECEVLPKGFTFRSSNETVDMLSRACVAISLNPDRRFAIYHCCNPQLDQYDLEPADFGFYWSELPYDSFKRICRARGEASPLHGRWSVLDQFGPYWFSRDKPQDRLPVEDRAFREDCPLTISWARTFTKLRRTQDWVERNRRDWPHTVPRSRLDFDCLMTRAGCYARELGVDFDLAYPDWMRQSLQRLVGELGKPEARIVGERLGKVVFEFSRLLRQNAEIVGERRRYAEIGDEGIVRPVFIVGINRSGTTMLHRLMARDPRFWALKLFELVKPVLPSGGYGTLAGTPDDPRWSQVEEAHEAIEVFDAVKGIHPFEVDEPEEDFPIFKLCFRNWTYAAQFHAPGFARWLAASSFDDAYAFHRSLLQQYSWQRRQVQPGHSGQWLLKMPFHLKELKALMATYPDALFIQTHRTPNEAMASWCSLVARARSVVMEPLQAERTGAEQLEFMSDMMNGATRFRLDHPELEHRWFDLAYPDLTREPMATIREIYDRFGWALDPSAEAAMHSWLQQQEERRRREIRHSYSLDEYGLTHADVSGAFAPYLEFAASRGVCM